MGDCQAVVQAMKVEKTTRRPVVWEVQPRLYLVQVCPPHIVHSMSDTFWDPSLFEKRGILHFHSGHLCGVDGSTVLIWTFILWLIVVQHGSC